MIVKIISILLTPFAYFYALRLYAVAPNISFNVPTQRYFWSGMLIAFVLSLILLSRNGFIAAINHELTHGFWSLLSFKKPRSFTVRSDGSGEFAFEGGKNMMIVLSPYFFPILTCFVFPFYYIINPITLWFYAILGATIGYSFSIQIRQIHLKQSDLKLYGFLFSILIIIFFQIVLWGCYTSFAVSGTESVWAFLKGGFWDTYTFFKLLIERF